MVSRYLIEAGLIFVVPYALLCYLYTKRYQRAGQKTAIWVLILVLSLPSYAFWAFVWVIFRIVIDALSSSQ